MSILDTFGIISTIGLIGVLIHMARYPDRNPGYLLYFQSRIDNINDLLSPHSIKVEIIDTNVRYIVLGSVQSTAELSYNKHCVTDLMSPAEGMKILKTIKMLIASRMDPAPFVLDHLLDITP